MVDFHMDINAGYVELLELTEAVAQLRTANYEFNAVYMGRSVEKLVRASTENNKSIRSKVDTDFRSLSGSINALSS